MTIFEIFEESFSVLRTNKMRTALSTLGIIIGIGSVITLVTLGQASQESVKTRIQSLGANLLTIRPGSQQQGFIFGGSGNSTTLNYDDALALKNSARITTIENVAAEYSSRAQVSFNRKNNNYSITGVAGDYFTLRNITLSVGTLISEEDNQFLNKVAIIGPTVAKDLLSDIANPIGQTININGKAFTIIGVTISKGGNSDEAIYIPLNTSQKALFGVTHISTIYVEAKNENVMEAAQNQIGFLLLERHRLKTPEEADFSIFSQEDLLETVSEITGTFTSLLTGIAAISLIVGGIGIMNIMLVTVTERTTEIGLRKAIGAKRKTIILQFLIESIVLTISGGIIGVTLGIIASYFLTKSFSLPNVISWSSIGISVLVASVIGIIFGIYPAYKASRLQPIEALRYE